MHLLFLLPLVSPRARARDPIAVTDDSLVHRRPLVGHFRQRLNAAATGYQRPNGGIFSSAPGGARRPEARSPKPKTPAEEPDAGFLPGAEVLEECAFATFLSGSSYVPGALCLQKTLLRTNGAKCPLLLMYDDRPQGALRASERTDLEGRLQGANRLVPLSGLFARLNGTSQAFYGHHSPVRSWAFNTWLKLWIWALPARRVVLLDNDMVVYHNLTWLFSLPLPKHGTDTSSLLASNCGKKQHGSDAFNSGVMVIAPSLRLTAALQGYAAKRYAHRARGGKQLKYCEKTVGDQSLLNSFFRQTWGELPKMNVSGSLNFNYQRLQPNSTADIAVLHFAGMQPKPWACRKHCEKSLAVSKWKQACANI